MITSKRLLAVAVSTALCAPLSAFATNGMLLEGYGPIATGNGGAAMAYDNGTAAMMNNPATLGLMADGSRVDIAVGNLRPDVTFDLGPGGSYKSQADSFYMPAAGWVTKSGALSYGLGIFSQGGMGVDFKNVGGMPGNNYYSQVSVGRLIIPFAYNINQNLSVGGTVDYVWANLDLQYGNFFEFKDGSDYTGAAKGHGVAGKLGINYKFNNQWDVGAVYQTKGNIGDLSGANGTVAGVVPASFTFKGFDMPAVLGLGVSFQPIDKLMLALDVKEIQWSNVMDTPELQVSIGGVPAMNMPFTQKWDNQVVYALGASYQFNESLTGRIGANISKNPIPDQYLNPLFPAIVENHYTLGAGYNFNKANSVDFSFAYAPEVSATSPAGYTMKHSQTTWQLMYSYHF